MISATSDMNSMSAPQPPRIMFQPGTPMDQFPMRWDVRNTFLQFYDDEESEYADALSSKRRSASAPALLMKASVHSSKASNRHATFQAQHAQEPMEGAKETISPVKMQEKSSNTQAVDSAKRGGGLRRATVRQAPGHPSPISGVQANLALLPMFPGGSESQHIMQTNYSLLEPVPTDDVAFGAAPDSPLTEAALSTKSKRNGRRCKIRKTMVSDAAVPVSESPKREYDSGNDSSVTLMVRHIACCYSQQQVKESLDELGLRDKYNFVHVPLNSKKTANLGYFFVNFSAPEHAEECRAKVEGIVFGPSRTTKKCKTSIAHMQGQSHFARLYAPRTSEATSAGMRIERA